MRNWQPSGTTPATAASEFAIMTLAKLRSPAVRHVYTGLSRFFAMTLSQTDRWFALLRGVVFLGGIGWLLFVPLKPQQWFILAALLGAFSLYSGGLYALVFLRP